MKTIKQQKKAGIKAKKQNIEPPKTSGVADQFIIVSPETKADKGKIQWHVDCSHTITFLT